MPPENQVSATLTDENVTALLGHLTAIEVLLPFLISREAGDTNVMLGEKSLAFEQKADGYMTSHPQFLPNYLAMAEVEKDRALREQFEKFLPRLRLLTAKAEDTFNVAGNELMLADLAYYNSTGDAAKRGATSAGDIHADLATRYPGRNSVKVVPAPVK